MVLIAMDNDPSRMLMDRSMAVVVVFDAADNGGGISSSSSILCGDFSDDAGAGAASVASAAGGCSGMGVATAIGKSSYSIGGALGGGDEEVMDIRGSDALSLLKKVISPLPLSLSDYDLRSSIFVGDLAACVMQRVALVTASTLLKSMALDK